MQVPAKCDVYTRRLCKAPKGTKKARQKSGGTYFLRGVILHLELDASTLACDEHTAEDTGLRPNLAALADNKTFWCGPVVQTIIL